MIGTCSTLNLKRERGINIIEHGGSWRQGGAGITLLLRRS
jgi:hypothetical protein